MARYKNYLKNREFFKEIAKELFPRVDPLYGFNDQIALERKKDKRGRDLIYCLNSDGLLIKRDMTSGVYMGTYFGIASYKEYNKLHASKKEFLEQMVKKKKESEAFFSKL